MNRRYRISTGLRYEDEVGDDFVCGIIVIGLLCAVVALIGFSQLTCKIVVEAEGTITSVSYNDAVSDNGNWHRLYQIVLDNVTTVTVDDTMKDGVYSTEAREVGDYVYLVYPEWALTKIGGTELVTGTRLESMRQNDTSNGDTGTVVAWVAIAVVVALLAIRFMFWACQFKIVIERIPGEEVPFREGRAAGDGAVITEIGTTNRGGIGVKTRPKDCPAWCKAVAGGIESIPCFSCKKQSMCMEDGCNWPDYIGFDRKTAGGKNP